MIVRAIVSVFRFIDRVAGVSRRRKIRRLLADHAVALVALRQEHEEVEKRLTGEKSDAENTAGFYRRWREKDKAEAAAKAKEDDIKLRAAFRLIREFEKALLNADPGHPLVLTYKGQDGKQHGEWNRVYHQVVAEIRKAA